MICLWKWVNYGWSLCIYVSMYLCSYVSMYLCIYVSLYLCIICMCMYMYMCMYVCLYIYNIYIYVCVCVCVQKKISLLSTTNWWISIYDHVFGRQAADAAHPLKPFISSARVQDGTQRRYFAVAHDTSALAFKLSPSYEGWSRGVGRHGKTVKT